MNIGKYTFEYVGKVPPKTIVPKESVSIKDSRFRAISKFFGFTPKEDLKQNITYLFQEEYGR